MKFNLSKIALILTLSALLTCGCLIIHALVSQQQDIHTLIYAIDAPQRNADTLRADSITDFKITPYEGGFALMTRKPLDLYRMEKYTKHKIILIKYE